jgi:hypothetical protein
MDFFAAIAILCGHPSETRLFETEVLACQKYYVRCVEASERKSQVTALKDCLLQKQRLGGDK